MKKLELLISELETKITHSNKLSKAVSASSAGWHIDHSLLVVFNVTEAVKKSNPQEYKWEFNVSRFFVFGLNFFPRGKGKAPKSVVPKEEVTEEKLRAGVQAMKEKIKELDGLHPNSFFKHPYFGNLNLKGTIKMLELHTRHHIKIIDDIIKAG
jgi:hypothetical protein